MQGRLRWVGSVLRPWVQPLQRGVPLVLLPQQTRSSGNLLFSSERGTPKRPLTPPCSPGSVARGPSLLPCSVFFHQIYNEMIRDLLNPALGFLELREDSKGVVQVAGITEVSTINAKEASLGGPLEGEVLTSGWQTGIRGQLLCFELGADVVLITAFDYSCALPRPPWEH